MSPPANTTRLSAQNLQVKRDKKTVLHTVSFQVQAGEVYALLGGNGAGKSTTLLTFLGFLPAYSGHVCVNNQPVGDNIVAARQAIAYLPEAASLYEHLNAYENLTYFLQLASKPVNQAALDDALNRVALKASARQTPLKGYSKGMRQKVAIALSILRDTSILLLDEPTSGLDPSAIDEFHQLIRSLADSGKAILMVTHDVYGACHTADKIGLLHDGHLVSEFNAPASGPIDSQSVHNAFIKNTRQSQTPPNHTPLKAKTPSANAS